MAKKLFEEGAFLVLLDVPEKVEFGIDYNCWNVGPLFKGVKMIPPGLHFVFYRCAVEINVYSTSLATWRKCLSLCVYVLPCTRKNSRGPCLR